MSDEVRERRASFSRDQPLPGLVKVRATLGSPAEKHGRY